MRRLHIETLPAPGSEIALSPEATRHARVLRLRAGDRVALFDGRGSQAGAVLLERLDGRWRVRVEEAVVDVPDRAADLDPGAPAGVAPAQGCESPFRIAVAQGLARGGRMEEVIQACTELGARDFLPLACDRSVVDAGTGRGSRWLAVAREATRQCGRLRVPSVHAVQDAAAFLRGAPGAGIKWIARPQGLPLDRAFRDAPAAPGSAVVAIGPEGGWSPREIEAAASGGFLAVSLGPRVLRTEHAGPVLVALLQHHFGDLGAGERP